MRLGPVIHGGLLLIALLFAYQTATRSKTETPDRGKHSVWKKPRVTAVHLESESKTVRIDTRKDLQGEYLWGTIERTRTVAKPKPKAPAKPDTPTPDEAKKAKPDEAKPDDAKPDEAKPDEAAAEAMPEQPTPEPEVEEETIVTTREFPIGSKGRPLLDEFANLMAMRKLGPIAAEQLEEYGLHEKTVNLTVFFGDQGQSTLLIAGKSIYGSTDRYMIDVDTNIGYVISGRLVQPIDTAENSLGIGEVHEYDIKEVRSIAVKTPAGDKEILITNVKDEKGEHDILTDAESTTGEHDQTLATFIERVSKLKPTSYEPAVQAADLIHIATMRYQDATKTSLGYLELYRQIPSAQEPSEDPKVTLETQYFIKTERTRVLGKVSRLGAQRIDLDLVELFGIAPPPTSVVPEPPKPAPALPGSPFRPGAGPGPGPGAHAPHASPHGAAPAAPLPKAKSTPPKAPAPKAPAPSKPAAKAPAPPAP